MNKNSTKDNKPKPSLNQKSIVKTKTKQSTANEQERHKRSRSLIQKSKISE